MRQLQEWHPYVPQLDELRIVFHKPGGKRMTPNSSTLTLTTAGQTAAAATVGFDQNGNPMTSDFKMPAVSYSIDDTAGAVVKVVDNGDGTASLTAVASGSARLTATATSAEGMALTDTALISVSISSGGVPVLSSIKIIF